VSIVRRSLWLADKKQHVFFVSSPFLLLFGMHSAVRLKHEHHLAFVFCVADFRRPAGCANTPEITGCKPNARMPVRPIVPIYQLLAKHRAHQKAARGRRAE